MPAPSPTTPINSDETDRPHHTLSAHDIEVIAKRCEERAADGIAFSPSSVAMVVEAFRALARERAAHGRARD